MSCDSVYVEIGGGGTQIWIDMVENMTVPKCSFVCNEHLIFISLILSLIFEKKVRAICLKFLLIFSQGENKKE